jgi:hypothetical protein
LCYCKFYAAAGLYAAINNALATLAAQCAIDPNRPVITVGFVDAQLNEIV